MILEAMIDYSADRLKKLRAEALKISQRIFHRNMQDLQKKNVDRVKHMLRETDLTDILYHRHRETIAWHPPGPEVGVAGLNACGAGGRYPSDEWGLAVL